MHCMNKGITSSAPKPTNAVTLFTVIAGTALAVIEIILHSPEPNFTRLQAMAVILLNIAAVFAVWNVVYAMLKGGNAAKAGTDLVIFVFCLAAGWAEWFALSKIWANWWNNTWPLLMIFNLLVGFFSYYKFSRSIK